jgi:hypothetical protein
MRVWRRAVRRNVLDRASPDALFNIIHFSDAGHEWPASRALTCFAKQAFKGLLFGDARLHDADQSLFADWTESPGKKNRGACSGLRRAAR